MPGSLTPRASRPEFLDVKGAAGYLATTERHVRGLVFERKIPFHKVGGKVRISTADLDAFLAAGRVEASR